MNPQDVNLRHIVKEDRQKVYPPSQDTFILIDAILSDIQFIRSLNPTLILEVGIGSGAVMSSLALNLHQPAFCLGLDINKHAASLALRTLKQNDIELAETVSIDIFKGMNLHNKVDLIICNPPYVPSTSEEYQECQKCMDIDSSCPGGKNGREFIDKFLEIANDFLTEKGVLYLLYEEENGNLGGQNLAAQRTGCEGLCVTKICKKQKILID